jgi:phage terminase small subunit
MNGGQYRNNWRRGSAVPAAHIKAPAHLNAAQRRAFNEAVRSRPNFFTESDVRLLTAYAIACAAVEEMERNPELAETPTSYRRAIETMLKFSKALRLAPSARATNDDAVAPPAPAQIGNGGDNDDQAPAAWMATTNADQARSSRPAPWRRVDDEDAGHA